MHSEDFVRISYVNMLSIKSSNIEFSDFLKNFDFFHVTNLEPKMGFLDTRVFSAVG